MFLVPKNAWSGDTPDTPGSQEGPGFEPGTLPGRSWEPSCWLPASRPNKPAEQQRARRVPTARLQSYAAEVRDPVSGRSADAGGSADGP